MSRARGSLLTSSGSAVSQQHECGRQFAWALFDWANSPFTTLIITFVFPAYFATAIVGDEVSGQAIWGLTWLDLNQGPLHARDESILDGWNIVAEEWPMSLKRIDLELAQTPEFPNGSSQHGYEFIAPLDAKGHLDSAGWRKAKAACTVRRFWNGTPDEHGTLIQRKNGSWAFSYEVGEDDDEPIFRFDKHLFVAGEYVIVTEHDGISRPFRVVHVAPAISRQ